MRTIRSFILRLKSVFFKDSQNIELSEELQFHLDRETEQIIASGMSAEEAKATAREHLGNVSQVTEECYQARGTARIEDFLQDVSFGSRTLLKYRSFSVVTILMLAMGIGACTAIFSLLNAVLLRPLPYGDSEQIVYIYTPSLALLHMNIPVEVFNPTFADAFELKKQGTSFTAMTFFEQTTSNLAEGNQLERVGAARVDADFFKAMQSQPEIGRAFDANDERPANSRVVIISHALWKSMYEGKHEILGHVVHLDGADYQIVGVMPSGFEYPHSSDLAAGYGNIDRTQLWVPSTQIVCPDCGAFAVGRLKPGVKLSLAQTELNTIMSNLDKRHSPGNRDFIAVLKPLRDMVLGPVKPLMNLLLGAVGLVLLIACANAANLLLLRTASRTQELGMRAMLGARQGRLLRQMLTESLMLTVVAGCTGGALAWLLLHLLLQLNPGDIPRMENAMLDLRVFVFLVAVTAMTSLMFGVLPSIMAIRINLTEFVKSSGMRGIVGSKRWVRKMFAVAQIALVVVLLTGASLLLRSYAKVLAVPTGFHPSTVAANIQFSSQLASVSVNPRYNTAEKRRLFFAGLLDRLKQTPGVQAAGFVDLLPLSHSESMNDFEAEGYANEKHQLIETRRVTPQYFSAMGIPLIQGRGFNDEDGPGAPETVIVNESLAKRYFVGSHAVGQHIRLSPQDPWITIVGVIGDVRNIGPETPVALQLYTCLWQTDTINVPATEAYLAVRSVLPEDNVVRSIRSVVTSLDHDLAIADIHTMSELASEATARRRFQTMLLSVFSGIAMLMAVVGIYGLLSFSVQQRTSEIGIRMAVGSTRTRVAWLVLGEGLSLLAAGLAIGLVVDLGLPGWCLVSSLMSQRSIQSLTPWCHCYFCWEHLLLA